MRKMWQKRIWNLLRQIYKVLQVHISNTLKTRTDGYCCHHFMYKILLKTLAQHTHTHRVSLVSFAFEAPSESSGVSCGSALLPTGSLGL